MPRWEAEVGMPESSQAGLHSSNRRPFFKKEMEDEEQNQGWPLASKYVNIHLLTHACIPYAPNNKNFLKLATKTQNTPLWSTFIFLDIYSKCAKSLHQHGSLPYMSVFIWNCQHTEATKTSFIQYSRGRGGQISVSLRPAWSTEQVPDSQDYYTEKLCLKTNKQTNTSFSR